MNSSYSNEIEKFFTEKDNCNQRIIKIIKIFEKHPEWRITFNQTIHELLRIMVKKSASDMDIGGPRTNKKVWLRIFGEKQPAEDSPEFSINESDCMLISLLKKEQIQILLEKRSVDFAVELLNNDDEILRFRANIFYERDKIAANFRHIKQTLYSIKNLNIPELIVKRLNLIYEKAGLVLITGITGSGKSSTLDSIVDMNNKTNTGHIIIIGNPIEHVHKSQKCMVTHREIGNDTLNFHDGTIQALRQDPDIIVVGEMRDRETISACLEVTDSGHKVFSTLHTSSTVESIHRIIAHYPPGEQERIRHRLADVLKIVISQKLVPTTDGKIVLAKEILSVDYSVQAAIRNNNLSEIFQMISEGRNRGMITMQQDLKELVIKKTISPLTAMNYCNNRKVMKQLLTKKA